MNKLVINAQIFHGKFKIKSVSSPFTFALTYLNVTV